jgi:hypothetical protein
MVWFSVRAEKMCQIGCGGDRRCAASQEGLGLKRSGMNGADGALCRLGVGGIDHSDDNWPFDTNGGLWAFWGSDMRIYPASWLMSYFVEECSLAAVAGYNLPQMLPYPFLGFRRVRTNQCSSNSLPDEENNLAEKAPRSVDSSETFERRELRACESTTWK